MAHDPSSDTPSIALVGADAAFLDSIAATLAPVRSVSALVIPESIEQAARRPELESAAVVVVDLDGKRRESLIALQGLTSRIALRTPVIVLTDAFDDALARWFLQIRVADFLRKPVEPKEVLRTCVQVLRAGTDTPGGNGQIFTFLPAAGGVGLTTLAIETAMLLLKDENGQQTTPAWSISISSTAPAPTISTSSRASTSTRSGRARTGSTGNCSR